jgi:UDP-galactopyranose mutase
LHDDTSSATIGADWGSTAVNVVVIGAGFAGTCAATMLRERMGAAVTVLEQAPVPGGMLRTLHTPEGVAYEYGPRIVSAFRGTTDALGFVGGLVDLQPRDIYQGTRLRPEFPVIPFPVDRESLRRLPIGPQIEAELAAIGEDGSPPGQRDLRDYLESTVGPTLTELAFEGFNRKFWGRRLEEMPAEWGQLRRLDRIAETGDYRLPSMAPHYYPAGGFNPMFDQLLADVDVRYGVSVERVECGSTEVTISTEAGELVADLVVTTAPIDTMLGYRFGPLEWRGYRIEAEVVEESWPRLGTAPDGVPFSWVYTPWQETPVARTTDFGIIHHGHDAVARSGPSVVLREIVDDTVRMYPVWWEDERFYRYLRAATEASRVIPLGRLGLYKYVTIDTTFDMVRRLVDHLEAYLGAAADRRFEILREVRGDWAN